MSLLAVNHHYYRSIAPAQGIYPISPLQMATNIASIRAQGWSFGGEPEIEAYLANKTSARYCVMTLDDGLKEQMHCLEDLEALGVPALFFVSTAPVVEHRVLDVHKLHLIRATMDDGELATRLNQRFSMADYPFDDAILANQYRYDNAQSRRIKYYLNFVMEPCSRDIFISCLFAELHGDERIAAQTLYMDRDDWRILARKGYLGTHGHDHLPLASLTKEELCKDIAQSMDILRETTGNAVRGISYPFGGSTAVSDTVYACARDHGLSYGFTMKRDLNISPAPLSAAMQLHRIDVNDLPQFLTTNDPMLTRQELDQRGKAS